MSGSFTDMNFANMNFGCESAEFLTEPPTTIQRIQRARKPCGVGKPCAIDRDFMQPLYKEFPEPKMVAPDLQLPTKVSKGNEFLASRMKWRRDREVQFQRAQRKVIAEQPKPKKMPKTALMKTLSDLQRNNKTKRR